MSTLNKNIEEKAKRNVAEEEKKRTFKVYKILLYQTN